MIKNHLLYQLSYRRPMCAIRPLGRIIIGPGPPVSSTFPDTRPPLSTIPDLPLNLASDLLTVSTMASKGKKPVPGKKAPPPPKKTTPARPTTVKKSPKSPAAKATKTMTRPTPAYADLKPAPAPTIGNIPWGYGDVRIVGMARDPQWACAYWEVTDDAIKAARVKLNDPDAGLSLRVYDTTHRDFNGLNAHTYWDLGIDRGTPAFHFKVGRPGATIHIDVGVRNYHGGFVPIARSNAVEMPRDAMSADSRSEFTTVLRSGPAYTYRHRYIAPPPSAEPPPPPPFEAQYPAESEQVFQHLAGEGWARSEWMESLMDGRVVRWIRWSGPLTAEQLPLLPHLPQVSQIGTVFRNIEVLFQGERRVIKMESGEKVVYGPWKVTLEAVGPKGERKSVEQWTIRRRWRRGRRVRSRRPGSIRKSPAPYSRSRRPSAIRWRRAGGSGCPRTRGRAATRSRTVRR